MNYKEIVVSLLKNIISDISSEEISNMIEVPPSLDMGDFAFPCFRLAKIFRKPPAVIAEELAMKMNLEKEIEEIKVVGAYINFYINKIAYVKNFINSIDDIGKYGSSKIGNGKKIVLDYSSPNIAKPFHIGHLRTTIIGNSLYKIFEKLGYKSIGINHLGDWGTQFGKLIVAYKNWGSRELIEEKGIVELMKIYIKFHDEAEKTPSLNDEARAWFAEMENGNEEALELWEWFKEISLNEFKRTYKVLNIEFDYYTGESFYNDKMEAVIQELEDKNLLKLSEGARIVDLSEANMPPCLITKKDGSTLYATRDITAAIYRKETYDFEKCIYVTALDQNLHFAQFFKVIEKMGFDWYDKLTHVPYGLVSMETGKLSTRKGKVILLENLLQEAIDKTKKIIEEKNPNLENKEEVARMVGIGAIIFNDLYNNKIKDVVFSWDKVLNFEGETGPYVQYTHARCCSVLEKGKFTDFNNNIAHQHLTDKASYTVIKRLELFPREIENAANKLEPSFIARYVVDLAQEFNKFYHDYPIIVDDRELKKSRLSLVYLVREVIRASLELLGINSPEKM